MARNDVFLERCRQLMPKDPARAFVLLWCYLMRDHRASEEGFDRPRLQRETAQTLKALQLGTVPPRVHPVAALAACDAFLAMQDARLPLRPRQVSGEGGAEYYLLPRREGWNSLHASQPGNLVFWAPRYQVVPLIHLGIEVSIRPPESQGLELQLSGGRLRFSAGGFRDGALPDWNASSPYRCQRLLSGSERWRSIEELLSEAAKKGSKIVVLPELSVDPETLRKLREWLRREHRRHGFSLVVAGSFHLEVEGGDGSRLRRGVASLLDGYGEEILRHTKLRPMRVGTNGEFLEEDIEGGSQVELLHFGFGLLGLAICLDFCEESRVPIKDLWVAIEPALLLVPSMGAESTNNAHHRKAEALARQCGAVTVVASQHPKEPEALGLRWGGKDAKPQRETPILHGVITWPGWDGA